MTTTSLAAIKPILRFGPEWMAMAAFFLLTAFWAHQIGFSVGGFQSSIIMISYGLYCWGVGAVMLSVKQWRYGRKAMIFGEIFTLLSVLDPIVRVFGYLCASNSHPFIDQTLVHIDQRLGFDWVAYVSRMESLPALAREIMRFVYNSVTLQAMVFTALFSWLEKIPRLREIFWINLLGLISCIIIAGFFPAIGPTDTLKLPSLSVLPLFTYHILGNINLVRLGQPLHLALSQMVGLIYFPSYHTVMAIIFTYGFRKSGKIGWCILLLNLLMLPTIPYVGAHYLTDVLGGAIVAALVIALVRFATSLSTKAPRPQG